MPHVASMLARRLFRHAGLRFFRLFARPLNRPHQELPPGVRVRLLSQTDLQGRAGDTELDLRPESIAAAYARGDVCVGAFHADTLVGYCWVAFASLPHLDGVWVAFDRQVAWTYKSLVRASHRGRGIAPALYRFADAAARERGRQSSVICVESHNQPSVAAALSAGYTSSGYGAYRIGPSRVMAWCSPLARTHGVNFFMPADR